MERQIIEQQDIITGRRGIGKSISNMKKWFGSALANTNSSESLSSLSRYLVLSILYSSLINIIYYDVDMDQRVWNFIHDGSQIYLFNSVSTIFLFNFTNPSKMILPGIKHWAILQPH